MLTQIATIIGEGAVIGQLVLGVVLFTLWVAIEVIGYGGLAVSLLKRQRWVSFESKPKAKPMRDIKWGATVRAAGVRRGARIYNADWRIADCGLIVDFRFISDSSWITRSEISQSIRNPQSAVRIVSRTAPSPTRAAARGASS